MRTYIIVLLYCLFGVLQIKSSPIVKVEATIYWYGGYGVYKIVVPYKKKGNMFVANPLKHIKWIPDYRVFLSERPIPKQFEEAIVWNGLMGMIDSPQEEFRITEKNLIDLGSLLCKKGNDKEYPDSLIKKVARELKNYEGEDLINILELYSREHGSFELQFYLEDNSSITLKQKRNYRGCPWNLIVAGKKHMIGNCAVSHFLSKIRFEKEKPLLDMSFLLNEICTEFLKKNVF